MNFPSRVLVVDDDPLQQAILSEWLSNHGCQTVQSASDGKQAIDLTRSNGSSLDLIILDLSLPDLDGFEFMQYLPHGVEHVPLVIISSQPQNVIDMAAKIAELKGFRLLGALKKPLCLASLQGLIATQDDITARKDGKSSLAVQTAP
jgi:CheY-like chemotaxis protein